MVSEENLLDLFTVMVFASKSFYNELCVAFHVLLMLYWLGRIQKPCVHMIWKRSMTMFLHQTIHFVIFNRDSQGSGRRFILWRTEF